MEKLKFQKYSLRRKQRRRHTNLRNYAAFIITTIFVVVTASCVKSAHLSVNTISAPAITNSAAASKQALLPAQSSLPLDSSLASVQKIQHLTEPVDKEEEEKEKANERAEAAEEAVEIELQESSLYNLPVVRDFAAATTPTTTMNALNTAIDTETDTNTNTGTNVHTNAQYINDINTGRRRNIQTHSGNNNFSLQEENSLHKKQQQHKQVHFTRHPQHQHQHFDHQNPQQHQQHQSHYGNRHHQHHHDQYHQHSHDNQQHMQNNYDNFKVADDDDQLKRKQNSQQASVKSAGEYYSQIPWHKHHSKYSIEDLLNSKFEKRVSNDIDMDPCKAGELNTIMYL